MRQKETTVDPRQTERSELERELQARFNPEKSVRFTGEAKSSAGGEYVKDLVLPDEARGRMPITRDDYVIAENPALVEWERQVRKFLLRIPTGARGHRVTAKMVYTWATGIDVEELAALEGVGDETRGGAQAGSANSHLRHISAVLRYYFGKPYKTTIAGRAVGRAYTVRRYFRLRDKPPMCITLRVEWDANTLDAPPKRRA